MSRFILITTLILIAIGCEHIDNTTLNSEYAAEIVGFDLNCSTCFLCFPEDSLTIIREIGMSENNYYHAINLDRDTFRVGQTITVKLREAMVEDSRACITLYPSYNYRMIFIKSWKTID